MSATGNRGDSLFDVAVRRTVPGFELDARWGLGDELAVLFGYSGSGKSMTLSILAGLTRADSARVTCGSRVLDDSSAGVRMRPQDRRLGYVTQAATLFPHMSVRRNIEYGLGWMHRDARAERVSEVAHSMRIEGLLERMPGVLSGGQQQRVALARALAPRPDALLLDEPFSALDAPIREEMREVVRSVRERYRIPVVLVTHDLYEAYTMADRMVVYERGRVLQAGSPCDVFSRPAHPQVARLLDGEGLLRVPG